MYPNQYPQPGYGYYPQQPAYNPNVVPPQQQQQQPYGQPVYGIPPPGQPGYYAPPVPQPQPGYYAPPPQPTVIQENIVIKTGGGHHHQHVFCSAAYCHPHPKRFKIREKLFSLNGDFNISDEFNNPVFKVRSDWFRIGSHMHFEDLYGRELCKIDQRLTLITPEFDISAGGHKIATMIQRFSLTHKHFDIRMHGSYTPIHVDGDWFNLDYRFHHNGVTLATVSKKLFSLTDTYGVEIAPGVDVVFILACVLVIDKACHHHHHNGTLLGGNSNVGIGVGVGYVAPAVGVVPSTNVVIIEDRHCHGHHHHHHHHHHHGHHHYQRKCCNNGTWSSSL